MFTYTTGTIYFLHYKHYKYNIIFIFLQDFPAPPPPFNIRQHFKPRKIHSSNHAKAQSPCIYNQITIADSRIHRVIP